MYLSRLILNPRHRRVQSELARPYELHRSILSAFPTPLPSEERVLYRLESDASGGRLALLVQSESAPDWRWAEEAGGYLLAGTRAQVKQFDLALRVGQVLAFRLRANPTVKKKSHGPADERQHNNGIRLGLAKEEDQRAWLERKGEQHGFRVLRAQIIPEGMQIGAQPVSEDRDASVPRRRLAHLAVRYEGLLQVTDPDLVGEAVRNGIGSAKGFGFGLLSLAPGPG